jgi:hypothetical protein
MKENDHPVSGKVNSFGWRDKERTLVKPDNTYRIAVLGDSFVEALEVELDSTFLAITEKRLNEQSSRNIEVMNFGRSGMTQSEEYLLLKEEVVRFSPDLVAVLFWPQNDIADMRRSTAFNPLRPFFEVSENGELILDTSFNQARRYKLKKALVPFKTRSALISLILERYNTLRSRTRERSVTGPEQAQTNLTGYLRLYTARPDSVYSENYKLNKLLIKEMAEYCRIREITFLLICASPVYQTEDISRREKVDSTFRADFFDADLKVHADSLQIEYLGLHDGFKSYYEETGRSLNWAHWNYAGHRVAAGELSRKLSGILPDVQQR